MTLFVLLLCRYGISVGVWAFEIGPSQISSFFSVEQDEDGDILFCRLVCGTCQIKGTPVMSAIQYEDKTSRSVQKSRHGKLPDPRPLLL